MIAAASTQALERQGMCGKGRADTRDPGVIHPAVHAAVLQPTAAVQPRHGFRRPHGWMHPPSPSALQRSPHHTRHSPSATSAASASRSRRSFCSCAVRATSCTLPLATAAPSAATSA